MKVHELIKKLSECDQNLDVVLSKDAEGNGFKPLFSIEECMVTLYRDARSFSFTSDQAAVVLWP